jgi:hypothetical protein
MWLRYTGEARQFSPIMAANLQLQEAEDVLVFEARSMDRAGNQEVL